MLDYVKAFRLAEERVAELSRISDSELVVEPEKTLERSFGWIFFYTTRDYLETRDEMQRPVGNGPLVVEKRDGTTTFLSSGHPLETSIALYLRDRPMRQRRGG